MVCEWGSLINLEKRNERTRDTRNDSKSSFLIKLPILLFLRSCYRANRQGGEEVGCWNLGLETFTADKEKLRSVTVN